MLGAALPASLSFVVLCGGEKEHLHVEPYSETVIIAEPLVVTSIASSFTMASRFIEGNMALPGVVWVTARYSGRRSACLAEGTELTAWLGACHEYGVEAG